MRRVFAIVGFTSFFISLFGCLLGAELSKILCLILIALIVVILAFKRTRRLAVLTVLFSTVLLSSLNCIITNEKIEKINEIYCHENKEISGVLLDYPTVSEVGFNYLFQTTDKYAVKFSVMSEDVIDIEPSDKITGSFDFTDNYADYTEKVYFSAYYYQKIDGELQITQTDGFNIAKLRKTIKQGIINNTSYGRGLTLAIAFGDTTLLSDTDYTNLLKCGMLHTVAVSGLHLSIITSFLFLVLNAFGVPKKASSVISIIFILLFMMIIGFRFSIVRAGVMTIMYFSAYLFNREPDALNSMGLSFLILLFLNPYTAISCSFLLSASATLGLLLVFGKFNEKLEKIEAESFVVLKKVLASLIAGAVQSAIAIVFTLPVTYIFFGYFSVAGIFVNAMLSPLISALLIFGILLCCFSFIPFLPSVLGFVLDILSIIILKATKTFAQFKYCLINIDYKFFGYFLAACFIIISVSLLAYYFAKQNKVKIIKTSALITVNVFLVLLLVHNVLWKDTVTLKVQNTGGAISLSTVVDNKMIVVETGGKYCERKLKNEIITNCVDGISVLIVPTKSSKGMASAQTISGAFETNTVLIDTNTLNTNKYKIKGKTLDITKNVGLSIDNLEIKTINEQNSTALYLTKDDFSVLIIDELTNCNLLPQKYKTADVVIIPPTPPNSFREINAKTAIVYAYEQEVINSACESFDTVYSLRNGAVEIVMSDKMYIKEG